MARLPYNPFTNRGMITKPNEFVGRQREINDILARISNRNSASVVGERRIGKSSLLYYIFLTGNKRLNDYDKNRFRFIYLDFLDPRLSNPEKFTSYVLEKLDLHFEINRLKSDPLIELADKLDDLRKRNTLPILLFDEFEKIVNKKELFNDDFFEAMRSFCSSGLMAIVTATQRSLKDITDQGGLTSPLWNIFAGISLGEFTVDDDLNEPALFLTHFWKGGLKPTNKEKAYLVSYASAHPLVMQVVSYHVLRNREFNVNERILLEQIQKEISSYFRTSKEKVLDWLKKNTPLTLDKIGWTTEWLGKQLTNIIRIQDLINL